ncbi:hypothetical protein U8Q06_27500 (plasmid) [Rhizobium beringeri]|uniref:hypothetical protein n=1 Tax=Rhizobium beringeri TaxID=3019934 RepID=UPI002E0FE61B|nr:hypothetical protein U8Q06_27500 [Rhizobium beringeri]
MNGEVKFAVRNPSVFLYATQDGSKVDTNSGSVVIDDAGVFTVDLGKGAALTPSAVYRALVKMVLSVVAEDQLPFLNGTIGMIAEWSFKPGPHKHPRLPLVRPGRRLDNIYASLGPTGDLSERQRSGAPGQWLGIPRTSFQQKNNTTSQSDGNPPGN